jgi:hypothetical protein
MVITQNLPLLLSSCPNVGTVPATEFYHLLPLRHILSESFWNGHLVLIFHYLVRVSGVELLTTVKFCVQFSVIWQGLDLLIFSA